MTYSVIQWGTGTVGVHAVRGILNHPDLDLAGLWVHSESKAGRDAGELVGVGPAGIAATNDAEQLLASKADCISYMASSDIRPGEVVDDLCRMLAAGFNVVNTSFVPLLFPDAIGDGTAERLEAACQAGGSTLYTSGIDPGYGNVGAVVPALSLCSRVDEVRMMEIVNYATWDQAFTMFEIMGFGKTDPSQSLLLAPGSTALAWGPVVALVARALDVTLDRIEEFHEVIYAEEDFSIASGTVAKGGISGMRFEIRGIVGGVARIVVEHVTRLRDEDAPHWPQGQGYRLLVTGEPHVRIEVQLASDLGDHNHAGCLATAMHVINAIPDVVDALPGVVTMLDLPVYSGRHAMAVHTKS